MNKINREVVIDAMRYGRTLAATQLWLTRAQLQALREPQRTLCSVAVTKALKTQEVQREQG